MTSRQLVVGFRTTRARTALHTWLQVALVVSAGLATGVSAAQTPAAQEQGGAAQAVVEEVVVTGSRIAAPNAVSTSPIQVISAESIATTGKTDISDLILQLPQNFNNGLGQDLGNGTSGLTTAGGVATADLRGLGPNRTLVLVDGRRLGQGSPYTAIQSPAPDLDQIPAGLVERIEVVTGGASAAYGSDAIAGVINFIMRKNFQGLEVNGQWNVNWHDNHNDFMQNLVSESGATPATGTVHDGRQRTFDVLMGTNFADNRGNVTLYLSYRHADPVASSERDFGGCQLDPVQDKANNVIGVACGGSLNSNSFQPLTGPHANTSYSVYGTGFVPIGSAATTPPASFNSQPYIFMTRQNDRYNAAALAHQTVSDAFQPYAEFFFMNDRTHQEVAPSALFRDSNPLDPFGTGNYPVNCDNPLLTAQQASILCSPAQLAYVGAHPGQACLYNTDSTGAVTSPNCSDVRIGRRNIEGGGRASDYEHTNYRAVLGSRGDFGDAWHYDVYGQYYYTNFFNSQLNYLSFQSIDNALQVTGTADKPVCISGGTCVPYNIFADGRVTPAQLQYLYLLGTAQGTSTLRTLHAEVSGELGKYGVTSPWASEGVAVDVGYEHRNDHEFFQPDAAEQSGLLSGFGSAAVPIDNSVSVSEEFAELRVPLAQRRAGIHDLLFDTGFRRSDYSTTGVTNAYKFEVQYAPVVNYRLRASYDRAIRAPSVVELFNPPQVVTLLLGTDPCAPTFKANGTIAAPAAFTLEQCERTGVKPSQYGNGGTTNTIPQGTGQQLSGSQGGNPNLTPEQADTFTFGLNFAPGFLPGLSGSIDYYHIDLKDVVGVIPAGVLFSQCGNTGDPFACSQIIRNPVTGGLTTIGPLSGGGYVVQTNLNTGEALVSGVDVQLHYELAPHTPWHIVFDLTGTYLQHFETTPIPGAHTYDCAGYFGFTCETVNPRWHHILRGTWLTPWNFTASATWRYIGPVSNDNNSPDPFLHFATFGGYDYFNPRIPSYGYLDLSATWYAGKALTIRAGINNVLDKDPPLLNTVLVPAGQANTNDVYDMFGRQIFVAFTAKF
jgi:outer membrane receptor protein involved in Fe transport